LNFIVREIGRIREALSAPSIMPRYTLKFANRTPNIKAVNLIFDGAGQHHSRCNQQPVQRELTKRWSLHLINIYKACDWLPASRSIIRICC
jgi:hypothetical protein